MLEVEKTRYVEILFLSFLCHTSTVNILLFQLFAVVTSIKKEAALWFTVILEESMDTKDNKYTAR